MMGGPMVSHLAVIALTVASGMSATAEKGRPNILTVVVDDLGWGDVGYHDDTMHTPTIDGLAKEGNDTIPVLTLRSIMESQDIDRVDVLRMTVFSMRQWRVLKSLVNSGSLDSVLQLSLNMTFSDVTMWSEYQVSTTVAPHRHEPPRFQADLRLQRRNRFARTVLFPAPPRRPS